MKTAPIADTTIRREISRAHKTLTVFDAADSILYEGATSAKNLREKQQHLEALETASSLYLERPSCFTFLIK